MTKIVIKHIYNQTGATKDMFEINVVFCTHIANLHFANLLKICMVKTCKGSFLYYNKSSSLKENQNGLSIRGLFIMYRPELES